MNLRRPWLRQQHLSGAYDDIFAALLPAARISSRFLLIMGSGRNGSTLLSCILNNHPGICIPPENHLIPRSIRNWHLHPLRSWSNSVEDFCSIIQLRSQWNIDVAAIRAKLMQALPEQRNIVYMLQTTYGWFNKASGKPTAISGDKTPANTLYLKMIKKQLPESKIVMLIRDPRDVIASYFAADREYYTSRFEFMIWRWKNAIDKYESIVKKCPGDILLLRYEQLVQQPAFSAGEVVNLLNLSPVPDLVENIDNNLGFLGVQDAPHHQNLLNPISGSSIGKWKTALPHSFVSIINRRLRQPMLRYGYEL